MTELTSTGPALSAERGPGNATSPLIYWKKVWPRTDLLDLLGITHPIIQAPMSTFGGPGLVAAVSNAGALGSLGCVATPNQTALDQIQEIRRATNRPFNLNFFAPPAPHIDADATRRVRERLRTYYNEFDLGTVPEPSDPLPPFDEERLQLVLDLRPPN
jgi:nitronate monooxygenase